MLLATQHTTEYSREKKTMERDENVSEFKICPNESSTHQFALVQTAGGGRWFVCIPCQSLEGCEIKPVTKHAQFLYWKEGLYQRYGLPFILINTRTLVLICKTALMPLVTSTPPFSRL